MCGLMTCLAVATTLAIYNGARDASKPAGLHTSGSRNLRSAALGLLLISPLAVDAAQDFSSKHPKMMSLLEAKDVANRLGYAQKLPRATVAPRGKHAPNTKPNSAHDLRSQHPSKTMPTTAVRFLIAITPESWRRTCGGCMALFGLAQKLRGLGETVATIGAQTDYHSVGFQNFTHDCARMKHGMDMDSKRTNRNSSAVTVVVLPELWMGRCRGAGFLHVHWILSPVGGIRRVPEDFSTYYRPHDLVFNYGIASPGTAVPVPVKNLLQIINDPRPDDDFDLERHPKLPRAGFVFAYRKADVFHNEGFSVSKLHPPDATELRREHSMEKTVRMFLTHKYFVCYDPYSYLAWIAPMVCTCRTRLEPCMAYREARLLLTRFLEPCFGQLGCATIMHPINGMSKREWLMSTMARRAARTLTLAPTPKP